MKWRTKNFGHIAEFKNGLNFSPGQEGERVRLIGVPDFQDRFRIAFDELRYIEVAGGVPREFLLKDRDLVFVRSNGSKALVGRCVFVQKARERLTHSGFTIRARVTSNEVDPEFVGYFFQSSVARRAIALAGGGTNISNLSQELLASIPVPIPPKPEQIKMVTILGACDRAVEAQKALVTAKNDRLIALRRRLLTKSQFPQFKKQLWRQVHLADVVAYQPRSTTKPKGAFLAAGVRSHGKGVFLKPDFEADDIALEELFELRTDDLVVNITFGWEGAAAIVPPEANGALASHRFPTFVFKSGVSFPGYFRHVIREPKFVFDMGLASPGGAGRNRVLSKKDFLRIPIHLPPLEEQREIAAVLNACDREIRLLEAELEALKQQKRGLMQKLLTGEIRVKT